MLNNLFINGEYVTSLSQLRSYFIRPVVADSPLYDELLTYAVDGLIADWLDQGDEECRSLARSLRVMKYDNIDDEYFNALVTLFTGCNDNVVRYKATDYLELQSVKCHSADKEIPLTGNPSDLSGEIEVPEEMTETSVHFSATFKVKRTGNAAFTIGLESAGKQIAVTQSKISVADKKVNAVWIMENIEPLIVTRLGRKVTLKVNDEEFCCIQINLGGSKEKGNSLNMVKVAGGSYQMGATCEQGNDASENEIKKRVTIHDFFIATVPVTRHLWNIVMELNFSNGEEDNRPKTNVSYDDCLNFIEKLNQMTGEKYRLPTEEEWEFAARGGIDSKCYKYSGSNNISEVAWCRKDNKTVTLHEVGLKKPNELGIYDMSGNVWEWTCSPCSNLSKNNIGGNTKYMVTRGGCANSTDKGCRVSRRYSSAINHKSKYLGFRLAK